MRDARRKPIFSRRRRGRSAWVYAAALVSAGVAAAALIGTNVLDDGAGTSVDPGPVHVHALGLNPADRSLFIATHTGLYRLEPGKDRAEKVGDRRQDTMGFTIVGPDRFLGSGHPDLRDDLPPLLGLIESRDAGLTWSPVSLQGEVDFHALRARGRLLAGYDATSGRVLVSRDAGESWRASLAAEPLADLVLDPVSPRRMLAAGATGLHLSRDGGRTWKARPGPTGLLAWPLPQRLYVLDAAGRAWLSRDGGTTWLRRGSIGGSPAALLGTRGGTVYAATHEGVIRASEDEGTSWTTRSRP